jgi:hypothetical protein
MNTDIRNVRERRGKRNGYALREERARDKALAAWRAMKSGVSVSEARRMNTTVGNEVLDSNCASASGETQGDRAHVHDVAL